MSFSTEIAITGAFQALYAAVKTQLIADGKYSLSTIGNFKDGFQHINIYASDGNVELSMDGGIKRSHFINQSETLVLDSGSGTGTESLDDYYIRPTAGTVVVWVSGKDS